MYRESISVKNVLPWNSLDSPFSVGHAGEREHPQPGRGQADGLQEPVIQHGHWRRQPQQLHPGDSDPTAGTVSQHHAGPWSGPRDHGSGGPTALPLHQRHHAQQPAAAQRRVLVEHRHAAQVHVQKNTLLSVYQTGYVTDSRRLKNISLCLCCQVQHQSDGGVAESEQLVPEQSRSHPGAHHPGRSAAAGQEEDEPGRWGHLLALQQPHHSAGQLISQSQQTVDKTSPLLRADNNRCCWCCVRCRLWKSWTCTPLWTNLKKESPCLSSETFR